LLYRFPEDRIIASQVPALVGCKGIDVQGKGKLIVAPPSLHESGKRYCWENWPAEGISAAPDWLLEGVPIDPSARACPEQTEHFAWAALQDECASIRAAQPGE